MNPTDKEIAGLIGDLYLWIQATTVRIATLERLVTTRLNLTKEDFEIELKKTDVALTQSVPRGPDSLAFLRDFLRNATARTKAPHSSSDS
jgi:hypothetical protein